MTSSVIREMNESDESGTLNIIHLAIKLAPLVIFVGFLGTNVFLVGEDLDPIYLFLKYFPLFEKIIEFVLGLPCNSGIRNHWLLFPGRISVTFLGCLVFWGIWTYILLASGAFITNVHDMMKYLIDIVTSRETIHMTSCHSRCFTQQSTDSSGHVMMRVVIRRYKQTQVFVRELNNLVRKSLGVWLMCGNTLTIVLAFASIRYMHTMDFLFLIYMPVLSALLNLATYVFLGMVADLAMLPEKLIKECERKVKDKRNARVLLSLYRFRLKLDQVNIRRSFITAYFKNCLDNVSTFLLSTRSE